MSATIPLLLKNCWSIFLKRKNSRRTRLFSTLMLPMIRVHGEQEGRFFHDYDCYCYLPLHFLWAPSPRIQATPSESRRGRRCLEGGGAHRPPDPQPMAESTDPVTRGQRFRSGRTHD